MDFLKIQTNPLPFFLAESLNPDSMNRIAAFFAHGKRRFSSVKVDNGTLENYHSFNPLVRGTIQQLDSIAPRFALKKGDIEILNHPVTFYETLKEKILKAEKRIFLSSLYIGKHEDELVKVLDDALVKNPNIKLDILVDALRSTREAPHSDSTASLIAPLVEKHGKHRVNIRLYHTPHLHGWRESITPKRLNEIYGLQHMKIYGVDDEVILSGANLSRDYFTNRQDRYYLFKSKDLSNYYHGIQTAVSLLSYQLITSSRGFFLDWPTDNNASEPHLNVERFLSDSTRVLVPVLRTKKVETTTTNEDPDTLVYPVSSFAPLFKDDKSTELPSVLRMLSLLDHKGAKLTMTAGYFNIHPKIKERILRGQACSEIITASPEANSFYLSKGISGLLPDAYVYSCEKFMNEANSSAVKVLEWQNGVVNTPNGWSYHAKGLWVTPPGEDTPAMTVIGSSNYTRRAYSHDLECNALIITKDDTLRQQMKDEVDNLKKHTSELTMDDFKERRRVSPFTKVVANIVSPLL